MKTATSLGVLAAALLVATAHGSRASPAPDPDPPASDEPAALTGWLSANIDALGWDLADVSREDALYIQAGRRPPVPQGLVRAYLRWERFIRASAATPWRSALQLLEFDCSARTFREISWMSYAGSNFTGGLVSRDEEEEQPWRQAAPDSIMVSAIDRACAAAPRAAPGDHLPDGDSGESRPSR